MPQVKCAECGFLAIRKVSQQTLHEAPERYREIGEPPQLGNYEGFANDPVCFVWAHSLKKDYEGAAGDPSHKVRATLSRHRECNEFTDWIQGSNPKEHADMILLKKQQEWQEKMALDERAWRERQEAQQQQWREKDLAAQERRERAQRDWQAEQEVNADKRHNDSLRVARGAAYSNVWSAVAAGAIGAAAAIFVGGLTAAIMLLQAWLSRPQSS